MTAEAASDGDAPRAAANGEAAKNQTGPGSPVARRVCVDFTTWGAGFPSEFGTNYSSGRIVFTLPGNWSDVGCGAPTTPPTPSGEGCSDGARAAATVGGLALLLQVIVLIVNY